MTPAPRCFEDFTVGQRFESSGDIVVTAERITSFAAEFDPQPFHLHEEAARNTVFQGLAASSWHTAALTMRLLVESEFKPAGGIIGAGFDEFRWPRPVRPGMSCISKSKCSRRVHRSRARTRALSRSERRR